MRSAATTSLLLLLSLFNFLHTGKCRQPTFEIDYERDTFLMDGKPFRYISGSMHYFRVPPELWMDRLRKIRAAGFNAIQFYAQWNMHEPSPGNFTFEGRLDFLSYMEMAQSVGLYVVFRPGPYTCGERDGGGLPYWLYQLHPDIKMRTKDPIYLSYVDKWWSVLLPRIKKYLYQNGGPIILLQLENEYGSFGLQSGYCDIEYMTYLAQLARSHLGKEPILFTTDGAGIDMVRCGKVPGAYATVDFGIGYNAEKAFAVQRLFEPRGPLVNSEFYPGWFDTWGTPHAMVSVNDSAKSFDEILQTGANVNVYMAHGGTSFGFESGAGGPPYHSEVTSYDYDALISESGDLTEKYFAFKKVVAKYSPIPDIPVQNSSSKAHYGTINLKFVSTLFDSTDVILKFKTNSTDPKTFEDLNQAAGFVLYETRIDKLMADPSELKIPDLRDRGYIFINQEPKGILSRTEDIFTMPLSVRIGDKLQILVENLGRIGYGTYEKDFKGMKTVTLGTISLKNWSIYGLPLDNGTILEKFARSTLTAQKRNQEFGMKLFQGLSSTGGRASFWTGDLNIVCNGQDDAMILNDTFLQLPGWGKGVAFINGFNLGRYWPLMGPQLTLYVPGPLLKCNRNTLVLFELEQPGCEETNGVCYVKFVDKHELNGPTPINGKSMINKNNKMIMRGLEDPAVNLI